MSGPSLIADELGDLRALIRTLRQREAELRRRIIEHRPNGLLEGERYRIELRTAQSRRFDPALLPEQIRSDPRYNRLKHSTTLRAKLRNDPAHQNIK